MATIKGIVGQALFRGDAIRFIYVTPTKVSLRMALPYEWKTQTKVLCLDLGKGSLREFDTENIKRIQRLTANEVFPPFYSLEIDLRKGKLCQRRK